MIYELPMTLFPAVGPMNQVLDYSMFRGYYYTDTLRWSYGGEKGRNTVATDLYIDEGQSQEFVNNILDAGYAGVYIDILGFEDMGESVV